MPKQRRTRPRYGLTRAQIDECTRRRAAGDRAGAFAAAGIDVEADPRLVAREFGARAAAELADDLEHLVPDLLRWHLLGLAGHPVRELVRYRVQARATGGVVPLTFTPRRRPPFASDDGHGLYVVPAPGARYTLRYGPLAADRLLYGLHGLRELWDERRAPGLLARCAGVAGPPGADVVALAGPVLAPLRAGPGEEAWRAAGFEVDASAAPPGWRTDRPTPEARLMPALALRAWRSAVTAGAGAVELVGERHLYRFDRLDPEGRLRPRLSVVEYTWRASVTPSPLPLTELFPPAEVLELAAGRLAPEDLHPLVAAALFPASPAASSPAAGPAGPAPARLDDVYRVRCGPDWHELTFAGGELRCPHEPGLIDRELALLALGGPPPTGCAGAVIAWRGGPGRLPARLRELRAELYGRVAAGEADSIAALLDAGLDPRVTFGSGQTLPELVDARLPAEAAARVRERIRVTGRGTGAAEA